MQFKNPELLYALFLLLIPIIVHLFQLRKFQKVAFTNVAFLKEATQQTRKSSQIKKWLLLFTRLLLLACIVLAFAQPFSAKTNTFNAKKEMVIYLDNSFSMQAKGSQGELFKRAIQDIISNVSENDNITLLTNDAEFRNTSIKNIKNDLLQLDYSANTLSLEAALLKSKTFFSKQKGLIKNLIFISDFQQDNSNFNISTDSLTDIHLVKLEPISVNNIAIDSAYISETTASNIELKVILKNSGEPIDNLPVSLLNNNTLIAKTSVALNKKAETSFSIPVGDIVNGKITIEDSFLQFDNTLFFNINKLAHINVLVINAENDSFLKRIYSEDEFNYNVTALNQLNYNILIDQKLIILNELDVLPNALSNALKSFVSQGGTLMVIPSNNIDNDSYNALLNTYNIRIDALINSEKQVTTINYSHPLYRNNVFEKEVTNFQYPKVNSFYNISSKQTAAVLQFEDKRPFLHQSSNVFVFSSALHSENSNFKNSPLIVPTLYNIGKFSFKNPPIYFDIGKENSFDVATKLQQDAVLTLNNEDNSLIPKQQYFNNKVLVSTLEMPSQASIYTVKNNTESIQNVSFNYNRKESNLLYRNLSDIENITISNSINEIFDTIKSDTKINALWKWFVIFALALLIIEMLILKYFK